MPHFRSRRVRVNQSISLFAFSKLTSYIFFGLIALIVFSFLAIIWIGKDLPTPGKLINVQEQQSTRIMDRNNVLLYSVYQNQNRIYVTLNDIPKYLQNATVSVEDKTFYSNNGFSFTGYLRAVRDFLFFRRVSGGSGLTQQLVKNVLLSSEQTLTRKVKELILSIEVSKKYSKYQIMEMYLNAVSYGGANVGVEAASQAYFGKRVKDLDLAECAFLAGLPQAPSIYSPLYSSQPGKKYYIARSNEVLNSMVQNSYITAKQKDQAFNEIKAMQFTDVGNGSLKAPHFVMYVRNLLINQLHLSNEQIEKGGLQIITTLDYSIEKNAEQILKKEIDNLKNYNVGNGSAIVSNPKTGEVLAFIGGKDYFGKSLPEGCLPGSNCVFEPNVNVAIANRQPGSSLKPVVYATAFQKGYTPATMIMDVKTDFPTNDPKTPIYTPVNYDNKDHGAQQIRFALGNSLNIPAVKTLARIGIKDVMQNAYNMGIENWQPTQDILRNVGLSLVLGGRETSLLNEITAYGVFANNGIRQDPVFILKVTDNKGNILYQWQKTDGPKVISPDVCFLISHILLDNNARIMDFGPNSWLVVPGKTVSVKTGTTDQKRDNWTIGYTPSFVVGVWVGNDDNSVMNQAISSGETGASPIWEKIMSAVLKGKPDESPVKPDNVNAVTIDALGGGAPVSGQSTRSEYFINGTQPNGPADIYQKLKLSKHQQGKLANKAEIDAHDYDTKDYIVFHEADSVSTDGKNLWQDGINNWLKSNYQGQDLYHPPTDTSDYKEDGSQNNNPTPTPTSTLGLTPTLSPTPTSIPIPTLIPTH